MTNLHWQPVVFNVRYPKDAVERNEPYEMGLQVQAFGDVAHVALLADKGVKPELMRAFLEDCKARGFKKVVYEKCRGRVREFDLTKLGNGVGPDRGDSG